MEIKEYRYDAFISYRHLPADIAAADKLQQLLERHKKKNGKNLRVFRDRTELPTSPDLGNQIEEALRESRFLILICSPAYLQSKWCMQELAYFRQLHGNRNVNILPLLLEGEPDEVFPKEICYDIRQIPDENGIFRTVTVEIEPLGADIRGENIREQHKKLRTEYLRIAAPLLGVSFDALYQRAKRRQMLTVGIAAAVTVTFAVAFAFYNLHMLNRIDAEHQALLARESLRLATESEDALKTGDTNLAMLLAMEALPEDLDDPERPLVEEAEVALRSAVYSRMMQEQSSPLTLITSIDFHGLGWDFLGIYQKGSMFAVSDQENVYFYDSATGALLFSCPGNQSESFILDARAVLITMEDETFGDPEHWTVIYDITTGEKVYERTFYLEDTGIDFMVSSQSDILYFVERRLDENDQQVLTLLEAVNPDGTPAEDQTLPDEDLLVRPYYIDWYEEEKNYLEGAADYSSKVGLERIPHPETEQGEKYQKLIESQWNDGCNSAMITEDEELLIYSERGMSVIYSIAQMERGNAYSIELSGDIGVDSANKRIFGGNSDSRQIYSYDVGKLTETKSMNLLSQDGSRYAAGMAVYDAADLSTPLLEVSAENLKYRYGGKAGYHMTPDLEYVFFHTTADTFQLWSVTDGFMMELSPNANTDKQVVALTVSADGALVALAHDDFSVEVYTNTAEFVASYEFTDEINFVEFEGNKLLISGDWVAWIVDVHGQKPTVEIQDGCCSSDYEFVDQFLTSDGLLLCAGEYFSGAVDAIYDAETGACVFDERGYYQYNEDHGILLYVPADPRFYGNPVVHAAKRDENGVFRDIYTVRTQGFDMSLPRNPLGTDGTHFVLLDSSCCQVYEVETGRLVYTMYFREEQDIYELSRSLCFLNDCLYDLRYFEGGSCGAYPLLDLETLLEYAREYLSSDFGIRELSDAEKAKYFIEN